jgi:hypothetical protein
MVKVAAHDHRGDVVQYCDWKIMRRGQFWRRIMPLCFAFLSGLLATLATSSVVHLCLSKPGFFFQERKNIGTLGKPKILGISGQIQINSKNLKNFDRI